MPKIMLQFTREELQALQYPVIVEGWNRMTSSMSKKRKYSETFTEPERKKIRKMYNYFYRWHLVEGTPEKYVMSMSTRELIIRAANFFGEI